MEWQALENGTYGAESQGAGPVAESKILQQTLHISAHSRAA